MFSIVCKDTQITVVTEEVLKATRFINHRICMVVTKLDGTVGDLGIKVTRLANLDDEMFEEFSKLQVETREMGEDV